MTNNGFLYLETFKKTLKNEFTRPSINIKPILNKKETYNPNHINGFRTNEILIKDLNTLKINKNPSEILNKLKNNNLISNLNNLKISLYNNKLNILKGNNNYNLLIKKNEEKDIDDNKKFFNQDISDKYSIETKFNIYISKLNKLLKLQNNDNILPLNREIKKLYDNLNELEQINLEEIYNNIYNNINKKERITYGKFIYLFYKKLKDIKYNYIIKEININEIKDEININEIKDEKNINEIKDENVDYLLKSIQEKNEYKSFNNVIDLNVESRKNIGELIEKMNLDIDYRLDYSQDKSELRNYVKSLCPESLSELTNYDSEQIYEICKALELNPTKLSLEEAQFILDEISTFREGNQSMEVKEDKYRILERNGKYYVEIQKTNWVRRPIVVTIMGHVDHGKTSLLDYIHKTDVAINEKGLITQKLSTFQVRTKEGRITFIDTPGHAAFLTMRKRGVSCTDLVILVIAADDGIMPQTLECIDLIKKNNLKVLVTINKVDLASKETIDKIIEDVRGHFRDAIIVPISAKTGLNVDLMLGEIEKLQRNTDLKMDKNAIFKGYIYETLQDPTRGKCLNIVVKQGSLQPNDYVLINDTIIKVKKIHLPSNQNVENDSLYLSEGLSELKEENNLIQLNVNVNICSMAGNVIVGNKSLKQLQKYQYLMEKHLSQDEHYRKEGLYQEHQIPFVGINLRCEDQGSLEAIENYVNEFNENLRKSANIGNLLNREYLPSYNSEGLVSILPEESELREKYEKYIKDWKPFKIISKNLGNFNTNDLQLQQIGNIVNIGFNVENHINLNNIVRLHDVIYNIFNDLQTIYDFYFGELYRKKVESNLVVTQIGSITLKGVGKKQAVGTSVKEGQSKLNHFYSVSRNNRIIYQDLNVLSFQSNRINVKSLNKGDNNNCLIFKEDVTVELNDEIVAYTKQPLPPLFDSVTSHLLK